MVSKARLDFPEPERPVTTTRLSRGISSEMFLRLWTRAPCTAIVVRAAARPAPLEEGAAFIRLGFTGALDAIPRLPNVKEREFLHLDVALFRKPDGRPGLADESLVRQVLARRGHAAHVEVSLEMA